MRALFDVNFLIAMLEPGHVHHARVQTWWADNGRDGWATCPITENGFVRILSQTSYPNRMTPAAAVELLSMATRTGDHEFWTDDLSITDSAVFDTGRILGPNQITDIYLLGLAVRHRGRLATLDRSLSAAAVSGGSAKRIAVP